MDVCERPALLPKLLLIKRRKGLLHMLRPTGIAGGCADGEENDRSICEPIKHSKSLGPALPELGCVIRGIVRFLGAAS